MGHLEGWLWSDNIGWISLNCATDAGCDHNDPAKQYKVSVNSSGHWSGRAWSSSVGWLSFDRSETGNPPGGPYQTEGAIARYDSGDGKIRGWGRFLAGKDGGGWDGWIKLRCHEGECHAGWDDGKTATSGFFLRADNYIDGWAWGGTVVGWISPWSPSAHHYGLNIDPGNNYKLSGHIWSESIGWITFNRGVAGAPPANDPCPDGSCLGLLDRNDSTLKGWARAVNYGSGWDGWISLSGTGQDNNPYGPKLNLNNRRFEGWAYGGEVIGWISFNCLTDPGCDHTNPNENYFVRTTLEVGPKAVNLSQEWDYCLATLHPRLVWGVQDGAQAAYIIEIYSDSGLNSLVYRYEAETITMAHRPNINAGQCNIGGNGFQNEGVCNLAYLGQYWWRIKVRSAGGQYGPWSGTASFTVGHTHHWPDPKFSFSPDPTAVNQKTLFDSTASKAFGGQTIMVWGWTVGGGVSEYVDGTGSTSQNPSLVFKEKATYQVTLGVTDSANYGPCLLQKSVPVAARAIYQWREISPTD